MLAVLLEKRCQLRSLLDDQHPHHRILCAANETAVSTRPLLHALHGPLIALLDPELATLRTHNDKKTVVAKPGLVRINLTNDSTAAHNVSLEHNGEFEYGSTLTIHKGITTTFLTLAKGSYDVHSSVGTDEDKGMSATLIIT
jgi:hypothetical protein